MISRKNNRPPAAQKYKFSKGGEAREPRTGLVQGVDTIFSMNSKRLYQKTYDLKNHNRTFNIFM